MKLNLKAIIADLLLAIVGLFLVFTKKDDPALLGVGTSLVASSLVILLNAMLVGAYPGTPA